MKIYGCSRHGAVMGPCSRCYEEEARTRAIRRCRHVRVQYFTTEWRTFSIGGHAPSMQQEFGVLACIDCPGSFYVSLEEAV